MRTPDEAKAKLKKYLSAHWRESILESREHEEIRIPLGEPTSKWLGQDNNWDAASAQIRAWRSIRDTPGLSLRTRRRSVRGFEIEPYTHALFDGITAAARWVGEGWPHRLDAARQRKAILSAEFPAITLTTELFGKLAALNDADFDIACRAAHWFANNDETGLTARQVPVTGMHSKWLNAHRGEIAALAGRKDQTLHLENRPGYVFLTYLDPDYRQSGQRIHDSYTIGDNFTLPYKPALVLVVENRDSRLYFPPLPRAVVIEGSGKEAIARVAQLPWLAGVPTYYWGDIDADGYSIVDGIRSRGVNVTTICMDRATFDRYAALGGADPSTSNTREATRNLTALTEEERSVYDLITDPQWQGPRRIEQERIPFAEAIGQLFEKQR